MLDINGVSVPFLPVGGIPDRKPASTGSLQEGNKGTPFSEIFAQELGKLKFSGHAVSRMESRDISLSQNEISRLENAVLKAEIKNSKDSLVIMDEKAFIVNIPNKTVVTMFTKSNMDDSIVTKIDSAVFA